jgi:hypothetical protein
MSRIASRAILSFVLCSGWLPSAAAQNWSLWQGPQGGVRLRAQLRDQEQSARQHLASIEVEVQNVWLHYPSPVQQAGVQAAVLEYQLDSCPPILTTDTRLRFNQLKQGIHHVNVGLLRADNNSPLSPIVTLEVNIP